MGRTEKGSRRRCCLICVKMSRFSCTEQGGWDNIGLAFWLAVCQVSSLFAHSTIEICFSPKSVLNTPGPGKLAHLT